MENFDFSVLLLMILPLLFAITVHEAAHGYVARHYGDRTAEMLGRLTLNPLKHIDPIGTIVVPLAIFLISLSTGGPGFIFGWAKPVPINTRNFSNVRIGMRMTAIAGPIANLIMMLIWGLILGLSMYMPEQFQEPIARMSQFGISFNAVLFALNMLPILPLDGGRFVDTFLPVKLSMQFQKIEPYGTWILIILLMSNILGKILFPIVNFLISITLYLIHFIFS